MKKRNRSRRRNVSGARGPFFRSVPAGQLTQDDRREFAASVGENARAEMVDAFQRIQHVTAGVEPYLALAVMASYALMRFAGSRTDRPLTSSGVQQGHVEYLQALFLRLQPRQEAPLATPEDLQVLFESLPRLFAAQQNARMPTREEMDQPESSERGALRLVQEYLRAHTSVVRNWGYFGNMTRISGELLSSIDAPFKEKLGLAATDVVKLFEHMVQRHESRVSAHWSTVQDVFAYQSVGELVDAFFERFPFKGDVEQFAACLNVDFHPEVTHLAR